MKTQDNEKKVLKMNLCDSDSYKDILTQCLEEKNLKRMNVNHMANVMALFAESLITYHPRISSIFEGSRAVEYTIQVKHSEDKDVLKMKSKPVSAIDDTFTATCDDPEQSTMDFEQGEDEDEPINDDDSNAHKALPAPKEKTLELGMNDDVVDVETVDEEGEENE